MTMTIAEPITPDKFAREIAERLQSNDLSVLRRGRAIYEMRGEIEIELSVHKGRSTNRALGVHDFFANMHAAMRTANVVRSLSLEQTLGADRLDLFRDYWSIAQQAWGRVTTRNGPASVRQYLDSIGLRTDFSWSFDRALDEGVFFKRARDDTRPVVHLEYWVSDISDLDRWAAYVVSYYADGRDLLVRSIESSLE